MASPSPRFQITTIALMKQRLTLCYHARIVHHMDPGVHEVIRVLQICDAKNTLAPINPLRFINCGLPFQVKTIV